MRTWFRRFRFVAAIACLPMNDVDAALKEAERAVKDLGLKGVKINSHIRGEYLDHPKFGVVAKVLRLDAATD